MEIGMLKQLRPANFILVLYRMHSKPKPSSFTFILLYFWIPVVPFLLVCIETYAQPSLGVQDKLRF